MPFHPPPPSPNKRSMFGFLPRYPNWNDASLCVVMSDSWCPRWALIVDVLIQWTQLPEVQHTTKAVQMRSGILQTNGVMAFLHLIICKAWNHARIFHCKALCEVLQWNTYADTELVLRFLRVSSTLPWGFCCVSSNFRPFPSMNFVITGILVFCSITCIAL